MKDEVGSIDLGFPSRRYIVSVSTALAVIDARSMSAAFKVYVNAREAAYTIMVASRTMLAVFSRLVGIRVLLGERLDFDGLSARFSCTKEDGCLWSTRWCGRGQRRQAQVKV